MKATIHSEKTACYHCGEPCEDKTHFSTEKIFCCQGCKLVYEVLSENDLDGYYAFESHPGESQKKAPQQENRFDYLQDPEVANYLLDFQNDKEAHGTFFIPFIHCSSCIWLLENLHQIHSGILSSRVDFLKKRVQVKFLKERIKLPELVRLLSTIGYEPKISLSDIDQNKAKPLKDNRTINRLAVAGFCFGNMMLFSIPEYFSEVELIAKNFRGLFNYLNIALAIPVVTYSASGYYRSAWISLKQSRINMDVPIVLGIIALFFYSLWVIIVEGQAGYMDSLGGLLFFLLLGKIYQQKTYKALEFDRDYTAYFPIAVTRTKKGQEEVIPIGKLAVGDIILVRNEELIPADSMLLSETASVDFSFVTGEEVPVPKQKGDLIYAGGRQKGEAILLSIQKLPSQSYLTQLWNKENLSDTNEPLLEPLSTKISGIFTWSVLSIAFGAFLFWVDTDVSLAIKSAVSVLIVACPCALAMSTPFTLGNSLRIFGRNNFYLKNASVVERLALIHQIVFDKTGTLTDPSKAHVSYIGEELSEQTRAILKGMVNRSTHPLSNRINGWLGSQVLTDLQSIQEVKGRGIQSLYQGETIRLGSAEFCGVASPPEIQDGNIVYLSISGVTMGYFHIHSGLRAESPGVLSQLSERYDLHLLSGDHAHEQPSLKQKIGKFISFNFRQSPMDKLHFLKVLNQKKIHTLMVGDGLNDAGALQESSVGVAITDRVSHFSPASDAILDASAFGQIPNFLAFARGSRTIIQASFGLSFAYNLIGISLAVQGLLSPVICAILMPMSSISVVLFTTLSTNLLAWRLGLVKQPKN